MHPVLCSIGPFTVYTYGVALVIAFLAVTWLSRRAARRLRPEWLAISADGLVDFACWALLGGLIGGRLWYVATNWAFFARAPLEFVALWHGGLVWYGGLLGGLAAGWAYTRAHRLDFLRVMDQFIPFAVLGHAIGRIGCWFNGCCYGKSPQLPSPLIESLGLVGLFVLLRALQGPILLRHPGRLFGLYLALYAALRFGVEYTRGDHGAVLGGLTVPQIASVALFLTGLALMSRQHADV